MNNGYPTKLGRILVLDMARGAAIAAMISYHFAWDLYFIGFSDLNAATHPYLRLYAQAIAASFLTLSGMSLVLAHGQTIRWREFWLRLMIILSAAALVTVSSWFAFPDRFIFFGILHCIALSSLLALPFLRAPLWVIMLTACVAFILPWQVRSPIFEVWWLWWTGLGLSPPASNDYVPFFPWFGFVLAGIASWRALPSNILARISCWSAQGLLARLFIFAGRHSLLIYLTHQLILLGALYALVYILYGL